MKKLNLIFYTLMAFAFISFIATTAQALPKLQLGEGSTGNWTYDTTTGTWVATSSSFELLAFANSDSQLANGDYSWDTEGRSTQTAYLVFAAVPSTTTDTDVFDISVMNDGALLSLYSSGFGTPPLEDSDSLSPHGVYDTYFEIYEFNFDGLATMIYDTQPGETGMGEGFIESFLVSINSLDPLVTGIHIDLFAVAGDGILDLGSPASKDLVNAFAPYSHDAEVAPISPVPEPTTLLLVGAGLAGLAGWRRKYGK